MFQPIRSVNDLPDEVLEFILSYIPPYKDLEQCMLVNKRWYRSAQSTSIYLINNFLNRKKHKSIIIASTTAIAL